MVLIDKVAGYTGEFAVGVVVPIENKITPLDAHAWAGAVGLWLSEGIGNKASIVSGFDLSVAEGNKLDLVETFFNTLTDRQKDRFLNRVEKLTILLQFKAVSDGSVVLTKTQYKNLLGL